MEPFSLKISEEKNSHFLSDWEIVIKRKVNFLALISIINLAIGLAYFLITGVNIINIEIIFALLFLPFVFVVNKYINYIWATYWFYLTDFVFTTLITLKLGIDSYIIISFFPMIISMMHLLGRKNTLKHLITLSAACIISIITIVLGLKFGNFTVFIEPETKINLASIIIILCFTSTILLTILMIKQFIQQEENTKKALLEKEILVAEVYHRVKNNLNIVTSLLNLKKNTSDSKEVIEALEACQNRVYSIALVHQNIVDSPKNTIGLNFRSYIENLSREIQNSLSPIDSSQLIFDCDDIQLDMAKAIPCGLILNELITNSFKYAHVDNRVLRIEISLKEENGSIILSIKDNGPGFQIDKEDDSHKMGIELIKSLADQIDSNFSFKNQDGLLFTMAFATK